MTEEKKYNEKEWHKKKTVDLFNLVKGKEDKDYFFGDLKTISGN